MNLNELINSYETEELFIEAVDKEIERLIKENPDFVYPDKPMQGCNYNCGPGDNPGKCSGCIFGQAFQNLGAEVSSIGPIGSLIIFRPYRWEVIQKLQDNGVFWGSLITLSNELSKNRLTN